jgi:hypothetical protein
MITKVRREATRNDTHLKALHASFKDCLGKAANKQLIYI